MTEGRDVDDLSCPSKGIEELERCTDPGQFCLLTITSNTRTVRNVESTARERTDCARDLQEDHPGSTTECLMALRTEMLERLGAFDACDFYLIMPTPSELPQGGPRQRDVLGVGGIKQCVQGSIDAEPSALALIIVGCFVISAPYSLLTTCST